MTKVSLDKVAALKIGILVFLFCYVGYRAYQLSFTHDESFSFQFVLGEGEPKNTANNHILNTALMKVCSGLFGNSELSLRLPNLLAFILFSFGYLKISINFKNSFWEFTLFCVLFLNPFVLDFFSLARGYGLSLGFMMISLLYYQRTVLNKAKVPKLNFILIFVFSLLAVLSNFSLINYYLAVWAALFLVFCDNIFFIKVKPPRKEKWMYFGLFVLVLIPVYFVAKRLLWLDSLDQLYFGANNFHDAIETFVAGSMYDLGYSGVVFRVLVYSIIVLEVLASLFILTRKASFHKTMFTILYWLIVIAYILEHWIFGSKFPMGRTMLFLFPLFLFFVFEGFSLFAERLPNEYSKILGLTAAPVVLIVFFHFYNSFNVSYVSNWKYDMNTKEVMRLISEEQQKSSQEMTLSSDWTFQPTINYYIESKEITMSKLNREGINSESDFIYDYYFDYDMDEYEIVKKFETSETILLRKR